MEDVGVEGAGVEDAGVEGAGVEDAGGGGAGGAARADGLIGALAGRRHGVVSRPQALAAGLTRQAIQRRLEAKRLVRLHEGVYAVGHLALTARSHWLAAVLACGPEALLSHRSAGVLWGLLASSSQIEVTAPRGRKPRPGIVVHRSRLIHPEDRALRDAIPVTSVARTLVDLADALDERRLADVVKEAEVLRLFDLTALERTQARLAGRIGRHRLRRVLTAYRDEPSFTRSEAERRFLHLCTRHGLPRPQANVFIAGHEVDFFWPDAALALEVDGAAFHRTRRAFHEDRRRDRALAAQGIHVIRVSWRDLDAGESLAGEIEAILARRAAMTAVG